MDYNEYSSTPSNINEKLTYSEEIEYLVKELNSMAHAAGRYSRSEQLPRAIRIAKKITELREPSQIKEPNQEQLFVQFVMWAKQADLEYPESCYDILRKDFEDFKKFQLNFGQSK